MQYSEIMNAITMLPGFYLACLACLACKTNLYRSLSYALICLASIIHHLWKSVDGDDRYTFRLDLTSQQIFSFICLNNHDQKYVYNARLGLMLLTCISLKLSTVYDEFVLFFINLIMCILCVGNNMDAQGKLVITSTLFLCGKTHNYMRAIFHPLFHLYVHVFIWSVINY